MFLDYLTEKRNSSKAIRIVSHFLFWIAIYFSSYYIIKSSFNVYKDSPIAYSVPLRQTLGLIVFFYPLMYVLIPKFLKEKRWIPFLASISVLVFLYVFIEALGEKLTFRFCGSCRLIAEEINPDHLSVIDKSLIDNILYKGSNIGLYFNILSGLILPIAIKSSLGYYQFYIKNLQLEKEKVQLELNFLKAQVNPHFLFNTLNNLYSLIIQKRNNESSETVTRLSDFMRYSLDNAHKKSILLTEEVKLINNYIELESLRLNHTKVTFNTNAEHSKKSIPPLLFIPLIENAFKYNVDKEGTEIIISLDEIKNNLKLNISNTFDSQRTKSSIGGLGLTNLIKRLKLYFSEDYVYNVTTENSVYNVYLKLILK
mgnify:CR=1 FL=1